MSAAAEAIAQCRAILEPGFAEYWNRELTRQSRKWFLQCAEIDATGGTLWENLSPDQRAKVRKAYAAFMSAETPHTSPHHPRSAIAV
jgi:hypothetical protein